MKPIILFLLLCSQFAWAQAPAGARVQIDAKLDEAYDRINSGPKKALEVFVQECLRDAQNNRYDAGIAMAYNFLGMIYRDNDKLDSALLFFNKSLDLRKKLELETGAANVMNNIASTHRLKGDYETALKYALEALRIHEANNDPAGASADYMELANIYENEGSLETANNWLLKSWIERPSTKEDSLNNARTAYNLAKNYLQFDLTKALEYAQKAKAFYSGIRHAQGLFNTEGLLADIFTQQSDLDRAEAVYKALLPALDTLQEQDPIAVFSIYNNYGYFLLQKGAAKPALKMLEKAEAVLGPKSSHPAESEKLAMIKADAFLKLNQLDSALFYQVEANRFSSILYSSTKAENMVRLGTNKVKKDLELSSVKLASQNRQNSLLRSLLGAFLIVFLLLYIAWQRFRKNAVIRQQQEELRFQEVEKMIRNEELHARTRLIERQDDERKRLASELHEGVGGALMTLLLDLKNARKSKADTWTNALEQSIATIDKTYTDIREISHEMRSGELARLNIRAALESFFATINKKQQVQATAYFHGLDQAIADNKVSNHLYRIVQELVTNTLKHARASEITLQLNRFEHQISLVYEDNGRGFQQQTASGGIGLKSMEDRVHDMGGTFTVESRPGAGFSCFIEIPYQEQ